MSRLPQGKHFISPLRRVLTPINKHDPCWPHTSSYLATVNYRGSQGTSELQWRWYNENTKNSVDCGLEDISDYLIRNTEMKTWYTMCTRRQLHKTKTFSETVGIERLWVQCKGIQHRIGKCSFARSSRQWKNGFAILIQEHVWSSFKQYHGDWWGLQATERMSVWS